MIRHYWRPERVLDFRDRVVVITGGVRGIGGATARLLAHLGATVVVTYHSAQRESRRLVQQGQGRIHATHLDVRDADGVQRFFREVHRQHGRIDVLVNNASFASQRAWKRDVLDLNEEDLIQAWQVDVLGAWRCSRAVIPVMRQQGEGVIIHMASAAAAAGDADTLLYAPVKVALIGLTRSLARMLAPGIRVNAIAPGSVRTHWLRTWGLTREELHQLEKETLLQRLVEPEEVAWAIAYLASPAGAAITGHVLFVDAGLSLTL